ncbi:MAG TPA: hypothetical protein VM165_25025 [Planctomycetaceae bacterium]|nr:hypothetical protein [Planctomycetaceae bacterium]
MRMIVVGFIVGSLAVPLGAAESPLVEQYLHSGDLARGEQVLEAALMARPEDDQIRFGLGVLQFVRGVERLGQSLYEYGCRSENANAPFLRLPVPKNPDPSPITYSALRRVLDGFHHDLGVAETTLAAIKADDVTLRLRLSDVRFDVTGNGKATERLSEILKRLMGRVPPALAENPDFQVCFDRGDVAWLRAYCHLLMAMIDIQLALDGETLFNLSADELFARPEHPFTGTPDEKREQLWESWGCVVVKEPARLGRFRQHLMQVCALNRETWKHIRAEQDNDYEWLPNSKQKGVIGLPVTDAMIDAWLGMVDEVEAVFDGRKMIPASIVQFFSPPAKKGLNLKLVLDDPPAKFDWNKLRSDPPADKYLDRTRPDMNLIAFLRVTGVFQNSLGVAYAVWFN